jgi:glutaredoxin
MPATDITVYRDPTTAEGREVSLYLGRKGVRWDDVDVTADPNAREQMRALSGQTERPLIVIDGTQFVGYDPEVLDPAVPSRFS